MRVSIIVGHTVYGKDKGAVAYNGVPESEWNYKVARMIQEQMKGHQVEIFLRDNTTYKVLAQKIKAFGPEIHMELHFNSFTKEAYGCECLALDKDISSIAYADFVTDIISSEFGSKERNGNGVLRIGLGGRGYQNLRIIKDVLPKHVPVVLIEPFFVNVKTPESEKFITNPKLYAESICASIAMWLTSGKNVGIDIKDLPKSPKTRIEMINNLLSKKGYGI